MEIGFQNYFSLYHLTRNTARLNNIGHKPSFCLLLNIKLICNIITYNIHIRHIVINRTHFTGK